MSQVHHLMSIPYRSPFFSPQQPQNSDHCLILQSITLPLYLAFPDLFITRLRNHSTLFLPPHLNKMNPRTLRFLKTRREREPWQVKISLFSWLTKDVPPTCSYGMPPSNTIVKLWNAQIISISYSVRSDVDTIHLPIPPLYHRAATFAQVTHWPSTASPHQAVVLQDPV